MKKLAAALLILGFLFSFPASSALAEDIPGLDAASSALLLEVGLGARLIKKEPDKKVEAAGLKRLPALLVICEAFDKGNVDGETVVTVSSEASKIKGATAFLSPNERIKAELLLKAAVILNAGDAAAALLYAVYPSRAAALDAVNSRLAELGIGGLDDPLGEGSLFTLNELAAISLELSESAAFLKYSSVYLDSIEHEGAGPTELTNPNRLVRFYSGCFGLATGSVGSSEYCGAFIAKRGTTTYLAIVSGMPDSSSRFKLAQELLDYGFASFRSVGVASAGESFGFVPVSGGTAPSVEAVTASEVYVLVPTGEAKVRTESVLSEALEAPVEEGAEIGALVIRSASGELLGEVPINAKSTVERACFKDRLILVIRYWLRIEPSQHVVRIDGETAEAVLAPSVCKPS